MPTRLVRLLACATLVGGAALAPGAARADSRDTDPVCHTSGQGAAGAHVYLMGVTGATRCQDDFNVTPDAADHQWCSGFAGFDPHDDGVDEGWVGVGLDCEE